MNVEREGGLVDKSESSSFEDLAAATSELSDAKLAEEQSKQKEGEQKEKEEWQDVLGSGSLLKKELVAGDEDGLRPQRGDMCRISYEVRLKEDGSLVEKRDNVEVYLGDNEILQGLDLVLSLMFRHEACLLHMAPRFGYGDIGLKPGESLGSVFDSEGTQYEGPVVGSDAWLEARLELHDYAEDADHEVLSVTKRMQLGCRRRCRGNWWYGRNETQLAVQLYRRALDVLDESAGGITDPTPSGDLPSASQALHSLFEERVRVHNNMAAAQLRNGAYDAALQAVSHVLSCQPNNAKALFRKSKILTAMGDTQGALEAAKAAVQAAPEDVGARKELARCEAKSEQEKSVERRLARRMMGAGETSDASGASPAVPDKKPSRRKVLVWGSLLLSLLVGVASVIIYRYKMATQ